DRHVEVAALDHRLQRWKNFLVGEIARGTEKDQCIRMGNVHTVLLILRIFPNARQTHNASPRAACRQHPPRRGSGTPHRAPRSAREPALLRRWQLGLSSAPR